MSLQLNCPLSTVVSHGTFISSTSFTGPEKEGKEREGGKNGCGSDFRVASLKKGSGDSPSVCGYPPKTGHREL